MNRVITWGSACGLQILIPLPKVWAQVKNGAESRVASTCLTERLWRQHPGLVETRGCGSVELRRGNSHSLSPLCPFDSRLWFSVCVSFLSFYSLMRMWGSERHYFKLKILTWRYNGKQQQEAFCCISLFVLFKLLGVSLKTLIKHMVGNPLINVHKKRIMYQRTDWIKKKDSDLQGKKLFNLQGHFHLALHDILCTHLTPHSPSYCGP